MSEDTLGAPAPEREMWSRRSVFILAAIGSAVGLGNIWRFPYVAYTNGGGAFLIPYLIALLTAGIPLLFLDYAIGHKFRGSAPLAFKRLHKRAEGIGWWQVGICFVISVYYAVIIAWALRYAFFSLTKAWGDDAETFFINDFLKQSGATFSFDYVGGVAWPLILVWVGVIGILAFGVQKGIGATARFFVPVLILLFLAVVVRALFLPGATAGLDAFFSPDWSALTNSSVWIAAYGQIFFSLSVAFGIMVTYSSYLKRRTNLTGSGLVVGFSNSAFEMLAGIGVFAALGFMALEQGKEVSEVAGGGIGLAFIAFPTIISEMPGGPLFGFMFFGSLVFAGFTSLISITQVIISAVEDKLNLGTARSTLLVGGASAIVSVALFPTTTGLNLLDVVDHFVNSFGIVTVALVSVLTVGLILRRLPALQHHLNSVSSFRLGWLWQVFVGVLTPVVLGYMMISELIKVIQDGYGDLPTVLVSSAGWAVQGAIIVFAILLSLTPWRDIERRAPEFDDPIPTGAVK